MGSGAAAVSVRFISCPCSAVLDLKPLFAEFRESQVLQMTSGHHVPDGGSAYTRPPVDKDLLGFLVVAADTGHRNRDSLFVSMLVSGEPCWPLGPALCPFIFTQPLTQSPGQ